MCESAKVRRWGRPRTLRCSSLDKYLHNHRPRNRGFGNPYRRDVLGKCCSRGVNSGQFAVYSWGIEITETPNGGSTEGDWRPAVGVGAGSGDPRTAGRERDRTRTSYHTQRSGSDGGEFVDRVRQLAEGLEALGHGIGGQRLELERPKLSFDVILPERVVDE